MSPSSNVEMRRVRNHLVCLIYRVQFSLRRKVSLPGKGGIKGFSSSVLGGLRGEGRLDLLQKQKDKSDHNVKPPR